MGEDAAVKFCDDILDIAEILVHQMEIVVPMKLTPSQLREVEDVETCYLCDKLLDEDGVRDYDHDVVRKVFGGGKQLLQLEEARAQEDREDPGFFPQLPGVCR